jgi:hypothetical protein
MKDPVPSADTVREISKEELQKTLEIIASSVVSSQSSYIQSMILLDHMLRLPNAREIFDSELKEQARDLWVKMKSTGLQLNDPPILFEVR